MSFAQPASPAEEAAPLNPAQVAELEREGWITARPPKAVEVVSRIVTFPRTLYIHRDLILHSVKRELEARFTGTLLGWVWPLVYPVFMFAVYYFIFSKLLKMKMPDLPPGQEAAMGVYMFVGVVVWTAFAESLARGTNVIVENGNLIKKLAFPSEALPLNIVLVNMVTMCFGVAVFIACCLVTPLWQAPGWMLLWLPVLLALQVLFCFGFTLILSTLQVFLRDTMQVVSIGVTVWMFLTPVFWAPEVIGDFFDQYVFWLRLNPTYHLVYVWRVVLMSGEPALVFQYDFATSMITLTAWALAVFAVGYGFFVLSQRRFADEV